VILAARGKVSNYPVGLINIIFFFVVFYQVQLYSDMALQVYFFIINVYGWWKWLHPKADEARGKNEIPGDFRSPHYGSILLRLELRQLYTMN
jgi:nicotinamide mononucleotide transporter